jgi:carboxyl-terminal processing protease
MYLFRMKKLLLVVILCVGGLTLSAQTSNNNAAAQKMTSFLQYLDRYYVDEVKMDTLVEIAIRSILEELDPHSNYMTADEIKKANEPLEANFEGIGIQFNILRDTILVLQTIAGGPSEQVGVQAGDKILFIDGNPVAGIGITNDGVFKGLRGKKGTVVNISVLRRGEAELLDFRIIRDKIPIHSVEAAYMADPKTGYVKLSRFAVTSTTEVSQAMDSLKKVGATQFILDLTGNTGGYLNQATGLSDLFLDKDKLITYTEGRSQSRQNFRSSNGGLFEHGKLIVMVDQSSASASEIVAGAIQDWDRGLIVGRRTYGKGLVQKTYFLPDQSAIRLTVSHYYTPSGRSIQKPYDKGREAYAKDLQARYESGELFEQDTFRDDHPDSLRFSTSRKRTVYGGGGISPDIFVPVDTSFRSDFYSSLIRSGTLNSYCIDFVNDRRESLLKTFPNINSLDKNFKVTTELLNEFYAFVTEKEISMEDTAGVLRSENLLKLQMKALIARNLFNSSAYHQIINPIDPIFRKAMETINSRRVTKKGVRS